MTPESTMGGGGGGGGGGALKEIIIGKKNKEKPTKEKMTKLFNSLPNDKILDKSNLKAYVESQIIK